MPWKGVEEECCFLGVFCDSGDGIEHMNSTALFKGSFCVFSVGS